MTDKKINAIIIGATGAVGRELVDYLLMNENYGKVTIFVRRVIDGRNYQKKKNRN